MKLLHYDKFLDSLIKLPHGIQKKVIDFQKKFRENSKSAAIHLEPISTFKDKSLRSARIDQTYRAIIKVPEKGDAYYLLWVDHHDKAYEWAMNKLFPWNENTQSVQVFTAPVEIAPNTVHDTSPASNNLFNAYKDKQLLKIGVPDILLPSVRKITSLDDLENMEQFIPVDVFENLFYLTDGADIDILIQEVMEGKSEAEATEEQINSINNQRSFIELTDDTLYNEVLSGTLNKWKYYLHPSQRKLVTSHFSGSVKISGGAGTGKTVAALHRLKHLVSREQKNNKILFTTYTRALTENLSELVKGFDISLDNITIQNIDALTFKLAVDYNLIEGDFKVIGFNAVKSSEEIWDSILETELIPFNSEFLQKEYHDVILYNNVTSKEQYLRTSRTGRGKPVSRRQRQEIWSIIEKYNKIKEEHSWFHKEEIMNKLSEKLEKEASKPYDYVLVDELQDFSNIELRLIRTLVAEKPNDLFMVGDPLQKIYDRKINFSRVGINVRGKRSQRLRINYRTTEEIKKLALSIIQDCHYDNFDGEEEARNGYVSLIHGPKPSYQIYKTKEDETNQVLDQINSLLKQGYKPAEIAITARLRDSLKDFKTVLHHNNLPYYEIKDGKTIGDPEGISLLTLHSIKGLEFKQVFLVDVNSRNCPKLPYDFETYSTEEKENYLRNEKSLLYVAVSRAIEYVQISGIGQPSELINI